MKKRVKPAAKGKSVAQSPACPETVNFFSRFDPDAFGRVNIVNAVLVNLLFPDIEKPFDLYFPDLKLAWDLAFAGNRDAVELIIQITTNLCTLLPVLEVAQPKIVSEIAAKQSVWPFAVMPQSGSDEKALAHLRELGVGKDIGHIDTRFHKAAGSDENYPARRWAKYAVLCLNSTRLYQRELDANERAVAEKLKTGLWKRGAEPEWVAKTKALPDFARTPATLKQWAAVIREMIRQQIDDFELRSEWSDQRNSCKARGQDKKGRLQNTILDDIVSALKTIAPEEVNLPKT